MARSQTARASPVLRLIRLRKGLSLLIFLALLVPNGGFWYQSGVVSTASVYYGVSAQIETARNLELNNSNVLVYVGAECGNVTLMVGYALFPPSLRLVNGSVVQVNGSYAVGFYGYVSQSMAVELNLVPLFLRGGSVNNYSLIYEGHDWEALINGKVVGYDDVSSVAHNVIFQLERANSFSAGVIEPVLFNHVEVMQGNKWVRLESGFSYVGFAPWSRKGDNPYGVEEAGNENATFHIGSGLSNFSGVQIWPIYCLRVTTRDNQSVRYFVNGSTAYVRASNWKGDGTLLEFNEWVGSGYGYSGSDPSFRLKIKGNVNETALYNESYLLNFKFAGARPTWVSLSASSAYRNLTVNNSSLSVYLAPANWSVSAYARGLRLLSNASSVDLTRPTNLTLGLSLDYVNVTLLDPFMVPLRGVQVSSNSSKGLSGPNGSVVMGISAGKADLTVNCFGSSFNAVRSTPLTLTLVLSSPTLVLRRLPLWFSMAIRLAFSFLAFWR